MLQRSDINPTTDRSCASAGWGIARSGLEPFSAAD
jgi:hypothetical protein